MVIIPSGLEIFRNQNTEDSKSDFPKLKRSLANIVNFGFSVYIF